MLDLSNETLNVLYNRLKVGKRRVNVRVEVDKFNFIPDATSDFDNVKMELDGTTPLDILTGVDNSTNISGVSITTASTIISPIENVLGKDLIVSSPFGIRNLWGVSEQHNGIDLAYGAGTKVVAVADGKVIKVNEITKPRYIEILHQNGIVTKYLHLAKPTLVTEKQNVRQGQAIGTICNDDPPSVSTGAHLDFRILINEDYEDPEPYIRGLKNPFNVEKSTFTQNVVGTINADNVRLREINSTSSNILSTLNSGTQVTCTGRAGEWYKVSYQGQEGYISGVYLTLPGESPKVYTNPTRDEIIDYISTICYNLGVPARIGLATAWTESSMTQFNQDGSPFLGDGGDSKGIMQVNAPQWKEYDSYRLTYDWRYNIDSGLKILQYHYNKSVELGEHVYENGLVRASYSGYNSFSNYDRYRTEIDQRDINFYNNYSTSAWGGTGGETTYLTITENAVPIYNDQNKVIMTVEKGYVLIYKEVVGSKYKVVLGADSYGYVESMYIKPLTSALVGGFSSITLRDDDFTLFEPGKPPKNYIQDVDLKWIIESNASTGDTSYLRISGGELKNNEIKFNVTCQYAGSVAISFKANLALGNFIEIYLNNNLVYSRDNLVTDALGETVNVGLPVGSNTIKIVRNKTVNGNDTISIFKIFAKQYLSKDGLSNVFYSSNRTDSSVNTTAMYIVADGVDVYYDSALTNKMDSLFRLQRGNIKDVLEISSEYVKLQIDPVTIGYVRADVCQPYYKYDDRDVTKFKSGRFVFDRTLVLDNVMSINIDSRFEMRAGTASITVANPDGFYSPDYAPHKFTEIGTKKSPFVEYDNQGTPLGVLSENTPIRIYIGYGDNPPRRFTGLINGIDENSDSKTMTIRCTDMMKKLNNYKPYKMVSYPPEDDPGYAWRLSSAILDMVMTAGMNKWRVTFEDQSKSDIVIEETVYTELFPDQGYTVEINKDTLQPEKFSLDKIPSDGGFLNQAIYPTGRPIQKGEAYGDVIDELCKQVNFWQRCDVYGTYRCTPVRFRDLPSAYFKDTETIVTVNKTIDFSKAVNHIMVSGAGSTEHFFNDYLWKAVKGERRSAEIFVDWATTYGMKRVVAEKAFKDLIMQCTTISAVTEGNPYIELLDTVHIEHKDSNTKDMYVVKGIRDSWADGQAYTTTLDLFLYEVK